MLGQVGQHGGGVQEPHLGRVRVKLRNTELLSRFYQTLTTAVLAATSTESTSLPKIRGAQAAVALLSSSLPTRSSEAICEE